MKVTIYGYTIEGTPSEVYDMVERLVLNPQMPEPKTKAKFEPGSIFTYDPKQPFSFDVEARLRQLNHLVNLQGDTAVLFRLCKKDAPKSWHVSKYNGVRVEFVDHLIDAMVETQRGRIFTTRGQMYG